MNRLSRALIGVALSALATMAGAQERPSTHIVPLFPAASDTGPHGVVRIVNLSDEPGAIDIVAIGADGARYEGASLAIGASETAHFDSDDLESGNPDIGLTGSTGPGQGDWRLELTSALDLEVQAYARTPDGAFAEMYQPAVRDGDRFRIATFNLGSDANHGLLWLSNRGNESVSVRVRGTDDLGLSPGPGISIDLPAGEARSYTAAELESGSAPGLTGSLGDGEGDWQLVGQASGPVTVMSLLSSPTNHLTNLSALPKHESGLVHRVPLFPPASDAPGREGFVRVINYSDTAGEVRIEAFDGTSRTYEALTLAIGASETAQFDSSDLEFGNRDVGLTGSTGAGEGDWRLELASELDVEVLSYVRAAGGQGYVTPTHATAAREADGLIRYDVPIFHAATYEGQESRLHLSNLGEAEVQVSISGADDLGSAPPEGDVGLMLEPGETRVVTAAQLENGGEGLDGRFGAGDGRWRLIVTADGTLQVMSLGYSTDGFLANLSRGSPPSSVAQIDARIVAAVDAPDLVVEALSVDDGVLATGENFLLSATVWNRGGGDAAATTLRYYRSASASISASDIEIGTDAVNGLAASGMSPESIALIAPATNGTYYYGACVDAVEGESDSANNCSAEIPVIVAEPATSDDPDLVVSVSVDNSAPAPRGAFVLSATVINASGGAAAATTLRYHRSSDATISTSDTSVGTDPVDALAASGTSAESITLTAPATPGTYYYGACADAVEGESDTANNCSAAIRVTVPEPATSDDPDLVVSVSVDNSAPAPGGAFVLSATVTNASGGAAAATTLRYHRSSDATISTSDTSVGTDPVDALAASGTSAESITLTAPATPGTYYYGACADAVEGESDTANNCSAAIRVTVPEPATSDGPNLVVSASVDNGAPAPGGAFVLSATVTNAGDGAAAPTTLRYFRSSDATISISDTSEGTDTVDALAASGTSAESITLTAPATPGTYYYGACADAVEGESDTANNCSAAIRVTVPEPATSDGPNLVVSASVDNGAPGPEGAFVLSATVTNAGDGAAAPTTLRYFRSSDATISISDTSEGTDTVDALAASGTSAESISLTAPATPGTYYYGACADAVEGESDTANNCSAAIRVTVPEPATSDGPDLVVSASVDNGAPGPEGAFVLSATVTNAGDGAAAPTTLRYFRSSDATISTSDTSVGTDTVDALAASGTSAESITLAAPATPGTYYYGACADAVEGESDTADNCSAAIRVTVPEPATSDGPNLVVSASVDNGAPGPEGAFMLSATVTNAGDGAAAPTTLRYYRSSDATISISDTSEGTDPVDALAASGTSAESISLTAPATPGTYYYGACADAVEGESDTADNCSPPVRVEVAGSGSPNLVVRAPAVDNANPEAGGSFTLSATVENVGDGASPATTLRYFRSPNARIRWFADTEEGSDAVEALPASGTSAHSDSLTALTPGTYYYGACVDPVEGESNAIDNCSSPVLMEVAGMRGPDLVVDATVDIEDPDPGDAFTLTVTVTNVGDSPSPAATPLGFYRSSDNVHIRTWDTLEGTDSVAPLAVSEPSTHSIRLTAPQTPMTYYYGACVKRVNGESDISPNCSAGRRVMVSNPPAGTDLAVHRITVDTDDPKFDEPLSISVTAKNKGAKTSGERTLTIYKCHCYTNVCDRNPSESLSPKMGEFRIAPLSAKEERAYTATGIPGGGFSPRTFTVVIGYDTDDTDSDNECGLVHVPLSE